MCAVRALSTAGFLDRVPDRDYDCDEQEVVRHWDEYYRHKDFEMKYIICLLLLFSGSALYSETFFVSANGLFVRQTPESTSPIINMIPFGTSINVDKTSTKQQIGKMNSFWYKLQNPLKGYVYGGFLTKKLENQEKLMLFLASWNIEVTEQRIISFSNGTVSEIIYGYNGNYYQIRKGRYRIDPNGIAIMYNRTFSMTDEEQKKFKQNNKFPYSPMSQNISDFLTWVPWIGGFATRDVLPYVKKVNNSLLNKNRTHILTDVGSASSAHPAYIGFYSDRLVFKLNLPKLVIRFLNE